MFAKDWQQKLEIFLWLHVPPGFSLISFFELCVDFTLQEELVAGSL